MKQPAKLSIALGLVAGLSLAACQAPSGPRANHWNLESIGPRVAYHTLGYRADRDGKYREFQWRQKRDINATLRRHLLNDSPTNPFQHVGSYETSQRPPNSVLPDPITFFHFESIAWGAVFLASGGTFVPLPLSSIMGMFESGGGAEFVEGINVTVTGDEWSDRGMPKPPDRFEVHNR